MKRISVRAVSVWLCLLAAPVTNGQTTGSEQTPLPDWVTELDLGGYLQAEYRDREGDDEFRVRRGRLKFTYDASDNAIFVIQGEFNSSGVSLKDAYIDLGETSTGWGHTLRAGQFKWPFGFEIGLSSSRREVPERSRVIRALFPGERDRGVMLYGEAPSTRFGYEAGIFNGNGTSGSSDDDSSKDFVGRLGFDLGSVTGGVSGYFGETLDSGVEYDKTRSGVDLQWQTPVDGLEVRAELVMGENLGVDVDGWYTYAIYDFLERHRLAVRLDEYDSGFFDVTTVTAAYTYDVSSRTYLMFAWEHPDDESDDTATVRLQYKF